MRRGSQSICALLIFARNPKFPAGFGTWASSSAHSTGCRGFIGPFPRPLAMRIVISTNADRLIYTLKLVNYNFFVRLHDLPGHWGINITRRLDRLDNRASLARLNLPPDSGQFHEHDIGQLLLRMIRNSNCGAIPADPHPLM